MSLKNVLINSIYLCGTYAGYLKYKLNAKSFQKIQTLKLQALIRENQNTLFGKEHHFDRIHDVESFKKHVPIREYEALDPYIQRLIAGESNVLTAEDIILFEPTGGTTSGSKLIPYTRTLKKEFQQAINPWLFDIYKNNPKLLKGSSYWSITPSISEKKYTANGIPIGFEDDSDYLGLLGKILRNVLVAPKCVNTMKDIENFRYVTSFFLLAEKRLSLISVWNPTFLILLLETMEKHAESIIKDIHAGTLTLPHPVSSETLRLLLDFISPEPARARQLEEIYAQSRPDKYKKIWKQLELISCWTENASNYYARKLSRYLPGTVIQGKGLIATEGIVTIPCFKAGGCLPAYRSHFLEFLEEGTNGGDRDTKLLHQLETGKEYYVIITTGGGLYRYNLKDKITVTGRYAGLPLLKFEGREDVCDIVGEKLSYGHVQRVVEGALEKHNIKAEFIMVAPSLQPIGCHYTVFLETKNKPGEDKLNAFGGDIESGLAENFHYDYAKKLEQIHPLKFFLIENSGIKTFFNRCTECGQKIGDIKPALLDKRTGWENHFQGTYI
ncbi:MAG: GH3 auxin-responsive promoter family protein [bacterium]|nr:GH3 auxin-responsive promoter family protein [bacterium]